MAVYKGGPEVPASAMPRESAELQPFEVEEFECDDDSYYAQQPHQLRVPSFVQNHQMTVPKPGVAFSKPPRMSPKEENKAPKMPPKHS